MAYIVTAAVVVAKTDSETGEGYFYKDAILPEAGSDRVKANHAWLAKSGLVKEVEVVVVEPSFPDGKPTEIWKVDQLRAYADAHGINLGDATLKADIFKIVNGI